MMDCKTSYLLVNTVQEIGTVVECTIRARNGNICKKKGKIIDNLVTLLLCLVLQVASSENSVY